MTKFGVIAQNSNESQFKYQKNPTIPNFVLKFVSDFVVQLLGNMSLSVRKFFFYLMNIYNADKN